MAHLKIIFSFTLVLTLVIISTQAQEELLGKLVSALFILFGKIEQTLYVLRFRDHRNAIIQ